MNESLDLKLTEEQCHTIAKYGELPEHLSKRLASKGVKASSIQFTLDELDDLLNFVLDAVYRAKGNERQKVVRIADKIAKLLGSEIDPAAMPRRGEAKKTNTVFQIKITLRDISPPIWRRIQTKDCTLHELHVLIQISMGWEFDHLYNFTIGGVVYCAPEAMFNSKARDVGRARLSDVLPEENLRPRFLYHYDFGDDWLHQIIVEERFEPEDATTHYPVCIAGERACPPEDCGGPWGYAHKLAAHQDPDYKWDDETLDWFADLDPERFDRDAVNASLQRLELGRTTSPPEQDYTDGRSRQAARDGARPFEQRTAVPSLAPAPALRPIVAERRTGRNERCPCGSGKKFKHCCLRKST